MIPVSSGTTETFARKPRASGDDPEMPPGPARTLEGYSGCVLGHFREAI